MHGLFISYRRDDASGYARLLYDQLVREFGKEQIFMDVESLREPGMDFVDAIEEGVGKCSALLALIGKSWASSTDRHGQRRLDNDDDFVRLEIATALQRKVRVMPILVQGASMPEADELPPDLQLLLRRQALPLTHDDWQHDVGKLIAALERIDGFVRRPRPGTYVPPPPPPEPAKGGRKSLFVAAAAGAMAVIGLAVWLDQTDIAPENNGPNVRKVEANDGPILVNNGPGEAGSNIAVGSGVPDRTIRNAAKPPVVSTPVPSPVVRNAQGLLAELDYSPGPADGLAGDATLAAVREFQQDYGLTVNGRIDAGLLSALQDASYAQDERYAAASNSQAAMSNNLSGIWYDNHSIPVMIQDNGGNLAVSAVNIFTQETVPIGNGSFDGDRVVIHYNNGGLSGTVVANLAPDGAHLNGTDTISGVGLAVPNSWHLNHMPGD